MTSANMADKKSPAAEAAGDKRYSVCCFSTFDSPNPVCACLRRVTVGYAATETQPCENLITNLIRRQFIHAKPDTIQGRLKKDNRRLFDFNQNPIYEFRLRGGTDTDNRTPHTQGRNANKGKEQCDKQCNTYSNQKSFFDFLFH